MSKENNLKLTKYHKRVENLFMKNTGKVLRYDEIRKCWDNYATGNTIRYTICVLRKNGMHIDTYMGIGYKYIGENKMEKKILNRIPKNNNNIKIVNRYGDYLEFGKYRNKKAIEDVIKEDPKYIKWCLSNIPWFHIDDKLNRLLNAELKKLTNKK